jgi:hypothetical protein
VARNRIRAATESVTVTLSASAVGVQAPFAIVAVVLPAGASAPLPQDRLIDLAGTEQLYAYSDGQHLHKSLRVFQGGAWTTMIDTAANAMSFAIKTGPPDTVGLYWSGIHAGDHFGFIGASATGCSDFGLDANLMPTFTVGS